MQRCIHRPKALLVARLPLTEVMARRGGRASAAAACQPIEDDGATAGAEWHRIASGAAAAAAAQEQTPTSIHIASPIGVLRGAVDVSQACTQEEKWQRRKVGEEPADRKLSTAGLAPVAALQARRLAFCLPCNRQQCSSHRCAMPRGSRDSSPASRHAGSPQMAAPENQPLTLWHLQHGGAHACTPQHRARPLDHQLLIEGVGASRDCQHQVACADGWRVLERCACGAQVACAWQS